MRMLSVILPSYNEEKMIVKAAERIGEILRTNEIQYEIIYVDDGSEDGTWGEISCLANNDSHIRGIRFSRNFGKEAAIYGGLKCAAGDCCAVMDCDLQHPPETLVSMYHLWEQGYEVVEGIKKTRGKESILYKASAGVFYKIISAATQIDMSKASDFKLLDRKAVDVVLQYTECNTFFRALSSYIGFKSTQVEFDVKEREEGESKWSTIALIRYAITNIVSFSTAPMQLVTIAGVGVFVIAVILGIQTLVSYFIGRSVEGFTTVIILLLFIGSVVMMSLGIIGYYIAKIYEEVKHRPRYIVESVCGSEKNISE